MNRGKTQIRQINKDREAFLIKWMKFMAVLVAKRSVVQVWHETLGLGAQAIHRSGRGDVQRAVVSISPGEICRLFRNDDSAEVMALRVPHPNSLRAGDVLIPLLVDLDAIRYAIIFSAGFLAEDPAIAQSRVGSNVVNTYISFFAVVNIKTLSIG